MARKLVKGRVLNPNLERRSKWSGLSEGDAVVVNLPKERRLNFHFIAHVRNIATNDEWVEVTGGREGEAKSRSFRPELIFPASSRHGSRLDGPSLLEAPRLPFE